MSKRASVQSYQVTELPRDIPESDSVESTRTLGVMIECSLCSLAEIGQRAPGP